jgi:predicted phosphodiesterase
VRVAVLADVHGNLPALRAVLAEVDREPVDAIVVAGDVVAGPMVRESLELLRERPEEMHWISGNSEREAVAAYDGEPASDDSPGRAAAWSAQALDRGWRDELAGWPIRLELDGVMFCHGSPRRDDEIITRATPDELVHDAVRGVAELTGIDEPLVVGGHTHQQFMRQLRSGTTYVNAGSVGLPYEGKPGAFWLIVDDHEPAFRVTEYDVDAAVAELAASGFPDTEEHLGMSLVDPADPDWVAALFEHMGGRGEHPGEPVGAH